MWRVLSDFEPVRRTILSMLKPVDVVSLVLAARITTTAWERSKYLNLFRHMFSDDIWMEKMKKSGGTVSVVGKDIRRFHRALRTWDYHTLNDKMNLLLVVKQPMLTPQAHFQENGNLLDNIDGTCLWTTGFTVGPTICKRSNADSENLEVYVMFTNRNIRIALNAEWTNRLLYSTESLIPVDNLGAVTPEIFRSARNYTWVSNLH
jgi:hypothetical protein